MVSTSGSSGMIMRIDDQARNSGEYEVAEQFITGNMTSAAERMEVRNARLLSPVGGVRQGNVPLSPFADQVTRSTKTQHASAVAGW